MELFYHVSRDLELPRSTRRLPADQAARACEACGRPVAFGGEPSEGGGTYGLVFCPECRTRLDRSAIQIHFCDGCGVSVPLYAVEGGAALAGDGRILCLKCRAPRPRSRRIVWIAVAAVAAAAVGMALQLLL